MIQNLWGQPAPNRYNLIATATSNVISGVGSAQAILTVEVVNASSWTVGTGTIQVQARLLGDGDGPDGLTSYAVSNLNYTVLSTGTATSGATALTTVGLYRFDITGLEVSILYTLGTATGTVGIRAHLVDVGH